MPGVAANEPAVSGVGPVAEPLAAPASRSVSGSRRGPLALVGECALVAVLTVACAAWALRLWHGDLSVPLRYSPVDDTKFYLMLVKGIIDHGWYLTNSTLGAPFGQQLFDYPQGADNFSLLLIRGLALFSSDPALVINLFFLLTFALVSASCHLVLRTLGVSAAVAGVVSVLFAMLPYHFFRGESHLLLSAYYAVPLSAWLFLEVLGGAGLFPSRGPPTRRSLRWASRRSLATGAACLVIGSANLYYATFALVLIAGATVISLVLRRWRSAFEGTVVVVMVVGTLAVNLAPSLVYRAGHGGDALVTRTATADETTTEALALRLTNLVLPAPGSRIGPLRRLTASYDRAIAPGYCEACFASLGVVGTTGLGWLALCCFGSLVGAAGWLGSRPLFRHAGVGVAIALAVGTVGGLSSLFELLITPDIRAWNRISVFIAFLCLLAVALLLDSLLGVLRRRRLGPVAAAMLLGGVLVLGVLDQTTPRFVPDYTVSARQWRSDATFVAEIEQRLGRGASIFELPYVPFPEGYPDTPVGDQVAAYATKYEPVRGYLHSSTLRWSYGAMKGRAADWPAQLAGQPLPFVVASAAAAGFDGLWVDPAGFEPAKARRVLSAVRSLLAQAPLMSPDGDLDFFDLRPYRRRLARTHSAAQLRTLGERTLHPLRTVCAAGGLELVNPSGAVRVATLTAHLRHGATVSRRVTLEPGRSFQRIPGSVLYATLTDQALAPFEPAGAGTGSSVVPGLTGPGCQP